jgi:hypothetical protein
MLLLLLVLCTIIGAYLWITDSRRVRAMAESELSKLVGGPVTVGHAKLSLFEGLRLENVNVYVDDGHEPDSCVFSANTFNVSYDLKSLLAGRLKLTRIVAIDPHVTLSEDLESGQWNYQRMERPHRTTSAPTRGSSLPAMPEVILRNAQIEYAEVSGGRTVSHASMMIEGQFAPSSDGHTYTFEMQSRGGATGTGAALTSAPVGAVGPAVTGKLDRRSGAVTAALRYFQFGKDIRSMLPAEVRAWWDRHELAGTVDIPLLTYTPGRNGAQASFMIQTQFRGVNLTVRPEEWMSRDELQAHEWASQSFDVLRALGMNERGTVDRVAALVDPAPIRLDHVGGTFTFTEDGIKIGQQSGEKTLAVSGDLEHNTFAIAGHIDGYSPLSPASLTITSKQTRIPAHPRYVTSMPRQVRELYDHLRPEGICSLHVALDRREYGGKLDVSGGVNIIDGRFVFDRFPYPVSHATGQILFSHDEASGWDQVKLSNLKGHGLPGGPNGDAVIHVSGLIAPLTSDVGVNVTVWSNNVEDEAALKSAFPREVHEALRNLDADGKGIYPKFKGGFVCRINRPVGAHSHWVIDTDVMLNDAAGKPVAFPYFMDHVHGLLRIREGYLDIVNATMKKGNSSLVLGGRVVWRAGAGGTPLLDGERAGQVIAARPELKVTARNVPIDKALLDALPEDRRKWLEKVGLSGKLDIDGRIWRDASSKPAPIASTIQPATRPGQSPAEQNAGADRPTVRTASNAGESHLTHAFDLTLHDGSIWPIGDGKYALSGISGKLRLLPDRLIISQMRGQRGQADLIGRGEVSWAGNKPSVFVSGTASRLELDAALYKLLPHAAKVAWDAVQPQGVVDVDLTYRGALGEGSKSGLLTPATQPMSISPQHSVLSTESSTQPSSPLDNLDLVIHPVKLSATLQAVPYRLDDISGAVRLSKGRILLTDLSGKHGSGTIRIAGDGAADHTDWDLRIAGSNINVDDAFRKAMPGGLASVINGTKLDGTNDFEYPKLTIQSAGELPAPVPDGSGIPPPPPLASSSTHPSSGSALDVDFGVKVALKDASMNIGVPIAHASGTVQLDGTVRRGRLAALSGPLDLPALQVAGRSASTFHADFYKPASQDALRIGKITGNLADGNLAGQVDLGFPDHGASRYVINLVLRDADIRQLSGDLSPDLSGELSASLALEGDWSDPRSRRGRGDVTVSGKQMYKIPLVLGLLQVTNLALPISSPFNQGSARYSVDGQTVTFDSLELRSRDMLMSGSGQLNFATRQVKMTFFTDNPTWPKLPIIGDLVQTARHELLQIHVKGTLEEPKVTASSANTLTTTVDEVLRGEAH